MNNFRKCCAFYNHIRSLAPAVGARLGACPLLEKNIFGEAFPLLWGPFPPCQGPFSPFSDSSSNGDFLHAGTFFLLMR